MEEPTPRLLRGKRSVWEDTLTEARGAAPSEHGTGQCAPGPLQVCGPPPAAGVQCRGPRGHGGGQQCPQPIVLPMATFIAPPGGPKEEIHTPQWSIPEGSLSNHQRTPGTGSGSRARARFELGQELPQPHHRIPALRESSAANTFWKGFDNLAFRLLEILLTKSHTFIVLTVFP